MRPTLSYLGVTNLHRSSQRVEPIKLRRKYSFIRSRLFDIIQENELHRKKNLILDPPGIFQLRETFFSILQLLLVLLNQNLMKLFQIFEVRLNIIGKMLCQSISAN